MPLSSGSMPLSPVLADSGRPSGPGRLFRSRHWRSARPAVVTLVTATAVVAGAGLAAAPAEAAVAATVVWVSPSGNDGNPGTSRQQPLRTPEHARDVVRSMNRNMAGDIAVILLPGTYRLAQPLALDAQDSGTNGHTVAWTAAPGARRSGHPPALRRRRTGAARQRPGPGDADLDEHRVHRVGADDGELAQPQPDRARLHRWRRVLGPAHRRAGRLDRAAVPGGVDLRYYDHDGAAVLGQLDQAGQPHRRLRPHRQPGRSVHIGQQPAAGPRRERVRAARPAR